MNIRSLTFVVVVCGCARAAGGRSETVATDVARCKPVPDTLLSIGQSLEALDGRYRLILVKVDSVFTAARTITGSLYLWRASEADIGPNGERPERGDANRSIYFGTTDADLSATDAGIDDFWRNVRNPTRTDVDPIHPPILGRTYHGVDAGKPWLLFWLFIGTVSNSRDSGGGLDGMGIVLDIKRIGPNALFGTWDRAGMVRTGHGHFCAYREKAV